MKPIEGPVELITQVMFKSKDRPDELWDVRAFGVSAPTAFAMENEYVKHHGSVDKDLKVSPHTKDRIGWTQGPKELYCIFEAFYKTGYINQATFNKYAQHIKRHFTYSTDGDEPSDTYLHNLKNDLVPTDKIEILTALVDKLNDIIFEYEKDPS